MLGFFVSVGLAGGFVAFGGALVGTPFFPALAIPLTAAPPIFAACFAPLTAGPPTMAAAETARSHGANFFPVRISLILHQST
ncbi:hypothetical protein ACOMCU_09030 [Lysinibacillus sp. UGB7]|uniref:hypothetical protein n=1 Tax=Lysinibacillus sp. UGB7 TaxID=3411039 RepID=UPI003B7F6779